MPVDLEAEAAVLGSILCSSNAADDAAMLLSVEDFAYEPHAVVFGAMMQLHDAGKPAGDLRLITDRLRSARRSETQTDFDWIGGAKFMLDLGRSVVNSAHVVYYSHIVRGKSSLRQLQIAGEQAAAAAASPEADPDELLQQFESKLTEIASKRMQHKSTVVDIAWAFSEALARIDKRLSSQSGEGVLTGYRQIDAMTGGLRPGELVIIAARPSCGKTALTVNVCENVAVDKSLHVLFVSLEMSEIDIADRMLSGQSQVKLWQMRNGSLSDRDRENIVEAAGRIADAPLSIDAPPSRSASEIASLARKAKRAGKLDLLAVDYVQLVRPENPKDQREQQVAKIAWRLKTLARELQIPVVVAAQLNRAAEKNERRPRLSDLRESGALEQHADMVWLIHWPSAKPMDAEEAEIDIAKQRSGPTGIVKLKWKRDYVRFEDEPATIWDEHRSNWMPEQMRMGDEEGF